MGGAPGAGTSLMPWREATARGTFISVSGTATGDAWPANAAGGPGIIDRRFFAATAGNHCPCVCGQTKPAKDVSLCVRVCVFLCAARRRRWPAPMMAAVPVAVQRRASCGGARRAPSLTGARRLRPAVTGAGHRQGAGTSLTGSFFPVRRRATPGAQGRAPGRRGDAIDRPFYPGTPARHARCARSARTRPAPRRTASCCAHKELFVGFGYTSCALVFYSYFFNVSRQTSRAKPEGKTQPSAPTISPRGRQTYRSDCAANSHRNPRQKPNQTRGRSPAKRPQNFTPIAGQHIDQNPRPAVIQPNRKCSPNSTPISRPTKNLSFFLPPMWGSVTGAPGQGTVFASILGAPVATNCGACLGLASGGGGPRFGWALGPWFWYVGGTGLGAFSGPVSVRPGDRFWCAFRDRLGCAL